jgi:hypothetical protein
MRDSGPSQSPSFFDRCASPRWRARKRISNPRTNAFAGNSR